MPYLEKCNPHLPLKVKLCWGSFLANTKHLPCRKLMKQLEEKNNVIVSHTRTVVRLTVTARVAIQTVTKAMTIVQDAASVMAGWGVMGQWRRVCIAQCINT